MPAALLLSVNPDLTAAELKAAMLDHVDTAPALHGLVTTNGRLNAFKALESVAAEKHVPVTGIRLYSPVLTIHRNKTAQLTATIYPLNATNQEVIWTLSNQNIVTISDTGLVTGIQAGTVMIFATSAEGGFRQAAVIRVI